MSFLKEARKLVAPEYEYVTNNNRAKELLEYIERFDIIEVDTEGTALSPFDGKITLLQLGVMGKAYVFDVRNDTEFSDIDFNIFRPLLESNKHLKLLQNAVYDMKMIKYHYGFYINNIYDTMLAEQLLTLGIPSARAGLATLVKKYLGLVMDKEPRGTFKDYNQKFKPYQLEYAAKDVCILSMIRDIQSVDIEKYDLWRVCDLEFKFTKALCEMELNGINIDEHKWRKIMVDVAKEVEETKESVAKTLSGAQDQVALFGVTTVNLNSPIQLKSALKKFGLPLESTNKEELAKYDNVPVVKALLKYRQLEKLISTYAEPLLNKVHPKTGRLHTDFKQLVSTGRLSSAKPNLQNIPGKQKFRSCFVAKPGCVLITSDMSGAELRIIGNMSLDPVFVDCYHSGVDVHTKSATGVYNVDYDKVTKPQRKASKAITFGLAYGLSKYGLARRLKISVEKAERMMDNYFKMFPKIKAWLEDLANEAVRKGYSETIAGRKRFYTIPKYDTPEKKAIIAGVKRQAKNAPIQGCLVFDSKIKGLGNIGKYKGQKVTLETGYGKDTATGVYSGRKDTYDLNLSNGANLGITLDHVIPVVTDEGAIEKEVRDINIEKDYLLVPLNIEDGQQTNIFGFKYEKGHWRETYKDFNLPDVMSKDLSFIIGCLLGDGTYTKHNHFGFVCPDYQYDLFEKFNILIENLFGYSPVTNILDKNRKTPLHLSKVCSVVIRGFLKHIGLNYVKHKDKSVPELFYKETVENKGALLNGLFSTDGGMTNESGPNFTTVSKKLANDVHQILFSLGINSNLKTYENEKGTVYRLQIPKRFNSKFKELIGFSVEEKNNLLEMEGTYPKYGDDSVVPAFIPKLIEKTLRENPAHFERLTTQEKAHLRRFKLGKCSFSSWRKFYAKLPDCDEKTFLSRFLKFDFCKPLSLTYRGKEDTYDLMCDNIHYFVANGVIVHNSNADTIKQAMIYCVDRLEKLDYEAKLLLTVHDEIIVECPIEHRYEVADLVANAIKDGFNKYFSVITMETDALISPCWMKGECDEGEGGCGNTEFEFITDDYYGTKLVCKKCGKEQ